MEAVTNFLIEQNELFRLPWSKSDNAMTWLEPTRYCNLLCDGCFQNRNDTHHKSVEQIEFELKAMLKMRKSSTMIIAGGEPLTHPGLLEITRMVKSQKVKPVIFTNGIGLDQQLIHELKKAGMFGFTFHIDSHQSRPGWKDRNETDFNELRMHYAEMIRKEGGLCCSFNTTIYPDTLKDVPALIQWASQNIDKVHVLTLIAIRTAHVSDEFIYHVGEKKINIGNTSYASEERYEKITTQDIYESIVKVLPNFRFCAYLGGTAVPSALKWAIGTPIGTKKANYGCTGGKTMELLQNTEHFLKGTYLAYTKPFMNKMGTLLLLFGLFDKNIRKTAGRYFAAAFRSPILLFKRLYVQTISVVQPVDILETGEKDNCDGCPNMTYWNGRLVTACRLDEYLQYGAPISIMPLNKPKEPV